MLLMCGLLFLSGGAVGHQGVCRQTPDQQDLRPDRGEITSWQHGEDGALNSHLYFSLLLPPHSHARVHAHTHSLIRSHLSPPPPPLCQDIFITDVKLDHSPIVPPLVLSYLEHSHSLSVSHLHWIPDHNEVRVKPSNYTPLSFYQQCG